MTRKPKRDYLGNPTSAWERQICRAAEEIQIQADEMAGSSGSTKKIDHVHSKSPRPNTGPKKNKGPTQGLHQTERDNV